MRTLAIVILCLWIPSADYMQTISRNISALISGGGRIAMVIARTQGMNCSKSFLTSIMSFTDNTCRVLTGKWLDPYTGKTFRQSADVDIDHMVPLYWAWQHGAHTWSKDKRVRFANDPRNLYAVQKSVNRAKSASGPLKWLPPNISFRCSYIVFFERISKIYDLRMSNDEENGFKILKAQYC